MAKVVGPKIDDFREILLLRGRRRVGPGYGGSSAVRRSAAPDLIPSTGIPAGAGGESSLGAGSMGAGHPGDDLGGWSLLDRKSEGRAGAGGESSLGGVHREGTPRDGSWSWGPMDRRGGSRGGGGAPWGGPGGVVLKGRIWRWGPEDKFRGRDPGGRSRGEAPRSNVE